MPNDLTIDEIRLILDALREKHGPGYSSDKNVGKLQAKLSVMLEVKAISSLGIRQKPEEKCLCGEVLSGKRERCPKHPLYDKAALIELERDLQRYGKKRK